MSPAPDEHPPDQLISNPKDSYGEQFQEHLLEQYKLYVDSSQKVSEKRISTGNYLLTVCSTLLTVFGIASTLHIAGVWLVIIPVAGLLVALTWYSLVISYKDLNTAKFKVIHELENYLPASLFRYEWHSCEQGQGRAYKPITHLERVIPLIFGGVFLVLAGFAVLAPPSEKKTEPQPVSVTGTVDVNVKSQSPSPPPAQPQQDKQVTPKKARPTRR